VQLGTIEKLKQYQRRMSKKIREPGEKNMNSEYLDSLIRSRSTLDGKTDHLSNQYRIEIDSRIKQVTAQAERVSKQDVNDHIQIIHIH
jgi:hypothetical protein